MVRVFFERFANEAVGQIETQIVIEAKARQNVDEIRRVRAIPNRGGKPFDVCQVFLTRLFGLSERAIHVRELPMIMNGYAPFRYLQQVLQG